MKRHNHTPPKKANRIFLLCLTLAIILMAAIANSQIKHQDEDRFSIQITTDNLIFQKGIVYGGVEFDAEFSNGVYVRPQAHYADLTDGYLEIASGIGYNITYNRWNYKAGIKLGVIKRDATYPIFGVEANLEYHFTDKFGIGLRGSYDARGDADFYGGDDWVYNSQMYLKFIL